MDLAFTERQERLRLGATQWLRGDRHDALGAGELLDAVVGSGPRRSAATDLAVVVHALGRLPAPLPFLQRSVLAGALCRAAASGEASGPAAHVAGDLRHGRAVAVCVGDPGSVAPHRCPPVRCAPDRGGWSLTGTAHHVAGAAGADLFLVVAGSPVGVVVAAVEARASAVRVEPVPTLGDDGRCHVGLDGARVADDALLASGGPAEAALARALDVGRAALAAEMAGAAAAALDAAVERARRRTQFGRPIGTQQALAHRLVDAALAASAVTDAVFDAAGALDRGDPAAPVLAASAKALANRYCRRVTATAHQVFGAAGIYADQPLHHWHRRVHALSADLGTTAELHRFVGGAVVSRAAGMDSFTRGAPGSGPSPGSCGTDADG